MQDQDTGGSRNPRFRVLLFALSLAGVVVATVVAPRLGCLASLEALGMATLVLVVLLLAVTPDSDAAGDASDITP